MSVPAVRIVVAPPDRLETVKSRVDLHNSDFAFADAEVLQAVEAIARVKPSEVVLERLFAATPRGVALIDRVRRDPELVETAIRVIAHDTGASRVVPRAPADVAAPAARDVDPGGTRRSARYAVPQGVEAQIDGNPVEVVDLGDGGAQVTAAASLRPNRRVRLVIAWQDQAVRATATVSWAKFELVKGSGRYRAGLEWSEEEGAGIRALAESWQD